MQSLSAQTDSTTVKTTWILPTVTTEATTFNSANFSPSQAPQTNSATSPQTTTSALTATATKIITASATQTTTSRPELNEKNLIGYWGQDTVYFDSGKVQGSLLSYCQSNNWDYINLSFMSEFSGGSNNYQLNFANFGDYDTTAITSTSSEAMLSIGSDIMACQKLGVKIFLSLGGATGGYSVLAGTGSSFATLLYNSFFSGSSTLPRPFGQAVLDGIDWDIEANIGSQSDVITTNQKLKVLEPGIMISAVPQCPFPDAYVGEAVGNADAEFDFISVQFYNNFCALSSGSSSFNFNAWAAGISFPIAIALPGSPRSASNGLATITQITQAVDDIMLGENSKKFFGLTFWDISSVSAYKASGDNSFFVDEARSLINGL
ncbi:Chitinase 1 [Physocladia obscura]|uniref:Chitinase 1 n=1 Tax=Physocladia obscura TaxID=109957 RepID=A0AAD5TF22_9FUNG|nr:Chitinase 1 [Physocladia obscura]